MTVDQRLPVKQAKAHIALIKISTISKPVMKVDETWQSNELQLSSSFD
jgi:hypothetical protein